MDPETDVCIVGGGPAGMMLGLLLARQGVDVTVLEKHADFLRDFRGDTVHPSTLDVLDQLGLAEAAAEVPHRDVAELRTTFADGTYRVADFSRLHAAHGYIRFMPQSDFLAVLAGAAVKLPGFRLLRSHEAVGLLERNGVIRGVRVEGPDGIMDVTAKLSVAADGRNSVLRRRAGLQPREFGAPMDVLWFRLSRRAGAAEGLDMHFGPGRVLLAIDRGEYWQVAYVIPKGGDERVRAAGIEVLRESVADLVPSLANAVAEVRDFGDVSTLTVRLDRLRRWSVPGLLFIGDAAHAMSPIGGVGINLAIQDAVCAARILAGPLHLGTPDSRTLASIHRRRWFPTAGTQLLQRTAQRFLVLPMLGSTEPVNAPRMLRLLGRLPMLQVLPARIIGIGLRPERLGTGRRGFGRPWRRHLTRTG
ncbi:MAG: FAD-dependent oxidoreductase [Actinomycetota bacterium]|nr:FAD-dependent oxidoreductase [Actinomycetota bacterium]